MAYYHVRITPASDPSSEEVRVDLSLPELMEHYVERYRRGLPLVIAGRTLSIADVQRIRISKSEHDSKRLGDVIRAEQRASGVFGGPSVEWKVANGAADITDEFITGPPGVEADSATSVHEEMRPPPESREVFVVHGRNELARNALFDFLTAIDLHPLEWSEVVQETGKPMPYIGEILDAAFGKAHAVVVLLTPDDEVRLADALQVENDALYEHELTGQARPNVLFEAGMAMGRNPDRTILVELGELRPFSDISGLHIIRLTDSSQRRQELAQRLRIAGCPVNLQGTRWHSAGDFDGAIDGFSNARPEAAILPEQSTKAVSGPQLSRQAVALLVTAGKNQSGLIFAIRTPRGRHIQVDQKQFGSSDDRRSLADAEEALEELLTLGLIADNSGEGKHFGITQKGFQVIDNLSDRG